MEVEKIGTLKPGDIGWGTCDGCEKNIYKFPGVLIQGITEEAAKLLYEKVEIVPVGTNAKVAELEARNKELMDVLEDFVIDVEGYFGYSDGDAMQPEDDVAYFIGEYCRAKHLIRKGKGRK